MGVPPPLPPPDGQELRCKFQRDVPRSSLQRSIDSDNRRSDTRRLRETPAPPARRDDAGLRSWHETIAGEYGVDTLNGIFDAQHIGCRSRPSAQYHDETVWNRFRIIFQSYRAGFRRKRDNFDGREHHITRIREDDVAGACRFQLRPLVDVVPTHYRPDHDLLRRPHWERHRRRCGGLQVPLPSGPPEARVDPTRQHLAIRRWIPIRFGSAGSQPTAPRWLNFLHVLSSCNDPRTFRPTPTAAHCGNESEEQSPGWAARPLATAPSRCQTLRSRYAAPTCPTLRVRRLTS